MPATQIDLYVEQGATHVSGFVWRDEDPLNPGTPGTPVDLSGATAHMQVRKKQGDPVLVDLISTGDSPGIMLGGDTGQVTIKMTPAQTTLLTTKTALYDMEITMPNGDVHRAVEGRISVQPNITQSPSEPVVNA